MWLKVKTLLFENTSVRQTVAKNTFWLGVSNFGGRLIRAIIVIYAARVLGAAGWGIFSYAITLAGLLVIFIDLGITPILTRETAKGADEAYKNRIISTAFVLRLCLLAIGIFFVLVFAPRFSTLSAANVLFPFIALILIFDTIREFGFSITRAQERMELEAGLYLLTNIAIVGCGFIFLFISPTVKSFTIAYVLGTGIGMVATIFAVRQVFARALSHFTSALVRPILSAAWPFAISGVLGGLMINTDILILGLFRSAEEVGWYSAAQRPIQLIYVLPAIIATSIFPALARLASQDRERSRTILERALTLTLAIALPMAIGGIILGGQIVDLLFGTEYRPATIAFQLLVATVLANFTAVILTNAVFAFDKQRKLITFAAIGGLGNAALDLLLIPSLGITGSGIATLVSQIVSNAYLWRTMKGVQEFKVLSHLKKITAAAFAMTAVTAGLLAAGLPAVPNIAISAFVYLAILVALREPLVREFKLILRPSA